MQTIPSRGFTLIEMVVATAIIGILMVAVGSAMVVAAKASPSATSAERLTAGANQAAQEIARELSQALTITTAASDTVTFTVPDRTGDALPETITYACAGDTVTRTINSAAAVEIARNVSSFNLGYTTGSRTSTSTSAAVEGAEQVLFACYDTSGSEFALETSAMAMQSIRPILPPEATSWRITKANLYCKRDGTVLGSAKISVFATDSGNHPTGSLLGQATVSELLMSSGYTWKTFTFGAMSIPTTSGAALVIANGSISVSVSLGSISLGLGGSGSTGRIMQVNNAVAEDGLSVTSTTNGGSSWSYVYDDALTIEVFGKITATSTTTSTIQTIDAAEILLTVKGARPIHSSVIIQPRPAFAGAPPKPILDILESLL